MKTNQRWATVGILSLVMGLQPLSGAVVYSENFLNTTGADAAFSTVGWLANHASTAVAYDTNSTQGSNPLVNGSVGSGTTTGFARMSSALGVNEPVLLWSTEIQSSSTAIGDLTSVSFFMRNQLSTTDVRLALLIGTNWYVTSSVYNTASASWLEQNVTFAAASWNSLSFTSGSTLSLGSSATLPLAGTINGIGFFMESKPAGYISFDDLTVNAVPEPSTYAILILAGFLTACRAFRKKTA